MDIKKWVDENVNIWKIDSLNDIVETIQEYEKDKQKEQLNLSVSCEQLNDKKKNTIRTSEGSIWSWFG